MATRPATDTIAAIATAPGVGGIGIVRISGSDALSLLRRLFHPHNLGARFTSHRLYYGTVIGPSGQVLDEALAVYMRAPHTYTREDVVELHCHGSFVVLQEVLRTVFTLGARPAEPGEFTKRAFLSGRIDLTRAEAVLELLEAQTAKGAELAVNQLQGELCTRLEAVRSELVRMLAFLEVAIDFPEDDVEIVHYDEMRARLETAVIAPLKQLFAVAEQGRIVREGIKVVIVGQPNVGKSSLLNALLHEERALVTPVAGTTRDTIEERFVIRGIPFSLIDTAGIRDHEDAVEALGIARARQQLQQAELVLFVVDARRGVSGQEQTLFASTSGRKRLVVLNKSDLVDAPRIKELTVYFPETVCVSVAALLGNGIEALEEAMYQSVIGEGRELCEQMTCAPNTRHRAILTQVLDACRRFAQALTQGEPVDLLAVDVQTALDGLGDLTGLTTPDDVLDVVFSQFCIGK